ncbi:hypothetical protein [Stenotrophomonas tumulicola]|uniref:Uncharacterized protein n=1 Tax=Stenotrophomonas tumulicola TaxID=1685415 RepID=A0A7W3FJ34_9GAMM|nr:hypothetical protein [Stenotrophomonas tumulicola]MBA8680484.1 hypothetical protein [Stenotrophomonas tumulicola]
MRLIQKTDYQGGLPQIAPPLPLADAAQAEAEDNQHEAENGICVEGDCE